MVDWNIVTNPTLLAAHARALLVSLVMAGALATVAGGCASHSSRAVLPGGTTQPEQFLFDRATKALDRACELLQEPHLGLKEVAERCGFCDEFHFSRRFKQRLGLSPSDFRRRWLAGRA